MAYALVGFIVAAALAAATTAVSASQQAQAQRRAAKFKEANVQAAEAAGRAAYLQEEEKNRRLQATARAAIGASGIAEGEGSELDVELSNARDAEYNARLKHHAYTSRGYEYLNQAKLLRANAAATQKAGYVGAGLSLLGSAAKAYGGYAARSTAAPTDPV